MPGGYANDRGAEGYAALFTAAADGDRGAFERTIAAHGPVSDARATNKLSSRIGIDAVRCPRCAAGYLAATRYEGHGKRMTRFLLPRKSLTGDAMRRLLDDHDAGNARSIASRVASAAWRLVAVAIASPSWMRRYCCHSGSVPRACSALPTA